MTELRAGREKPTRQGKDKGKKKNRYAWRGSLPCRLRSSPFDQDYDSHRVLVRPTEAPGMRIVPFNQIFPILGRKDTGRTSSSLFRGACPRADRPEELRGQG
jgi:hypothetical protein